MDASEELATERNRESGRRQGGVAACDRLGDVWHARPLDRVAALEALEPCVLGMRALGLQPEQMLVELKHRLTIGSARLRDRTVLLHDRDALLELALALYYAGSPYRAPPAPAHTTGVLEWPAVERRFGGIYPEREHARRVRDAAGREWRVYERVDRRRRPVDRSLIFEGDAAVRRVRVYPPYWQTLDDGALLGLSEPTARPVPIIPTRTATGADGTVWFVTEWPCQLGSAEERTPCLIFTSAVGYQITTRFPADWLQLRDEQLLALRTT